MPATFKSLARPALLALLAIGSSSSRADYVFNIFAGVLRTYHGDAIMPTDGLVLLVASPDPEFGGPTADSFVSGNDLLIDKFALDGAFGDGTVDHPTTYTGTLQSDWPVQLYWFPTLTTGAAAPGAGVHFGQYRHETGLDGSDPGYTKGNPSTVSLTFYTEENAGSNPNTDAFANQTVVPEPSTYATIFGVLCTGAAFASRKFRKRQ